MDWQNKNFVQFIGQQISQNISSPLFHADRFKIESALGEGAMQSKGIGDIYFHSDGVVIKYKDSEEKLLHEDIDSLGPQFHERIEFFYKDQAYRFTATSNREPGIKWEIASNVVWAKLGLSHRLSPYFRELIVSANL